MRKLLRWFKDMPPGYIVDFRLTWPDKEWVVLIPGRKGGDTE